LPGPPARQEGSPGASAGSPSLTTDGAVGAFPANYCYLPRCPL